MTTTGNLAEEQAYVSMLYGRLDGLRRRAAERLDGALRGSGPGGTAAARGERDVATGMYARELARLGAVEQGLCFGRLNLADGQHRHIGRLGIFDEDRDHLPLLVDWRAPAARPFYLATGAAPRGVSLRRHIRTEGRVVVGIDDEVLDLSDTTTPRAPDGVAGDTALLAALAAARTGHMRDIVETIQAEQDQVIRADHRGVLVVQGGPGTGKTAVALHRAAYLLYTFREDLSRRGVLIVGPNPTFLRYIERVLPSLGETGVVLSTVGDLYPGIRATGVEDPRVAAVKGAETMAETMVEVVAGIERVPEEPWEIHTAEGPVVVDPSVCERARRWARSSRRPHNQAREIFVDAVLDSLAEQAAERLGADPLGGDNLLSASDLADIRGELADDGAVAEALGQLWPVMTPQRLLRRLYSDRDWLAELGLPESLAREWDAPWTPADVPLLDEAAQLLGDAVEPVVGDEDDEGDAESVGEVDEVTYAQGVLDIAVGSRSFDFEDEEAEILSVQDLLAADRLAGRQEEVDRRSVAERAAADREWAYGHVILDEAQELSPMALRVLLRRCPSRSMTIVGDVAQTGALAGTSSWGRLLDGPLGGRWALETLTVNYRTPSEIMEVASDVLASVDPEMSPPRSVRSTGRRPWLLSVEEGAVEATVAGIMADLAASVGEGRVAVIVPSERLEPVGLAVSGSVAGVAVGGGLSEDAPVVVVTPEQAKGLEFDGVVVVDPERIVEDSPRGFGDLYVALTRATQRLGVVAPGLAPASLSGLDVVERSGARW